MWCSCARRGSSEACFGRLGQRLGDKWRIGPSRGPASTMTPSVMLSTSIMATLASYARLHHLPLGMHWSPVEEENVITM